MKKVILYLIPLFILSIALLQGCEDDPIITGPDDGSDEGGSYSKMQFHPTGQDTQQVAPNSTDSLVYLKRTNPELF